MSRIHTFSAYALLVLASSLWAAHPAFAQKTAHSRLNLNCDAIGNRLDVTFGPYNHSISPTTSWDLIADTAPSELELQSRQATPRQRATCTLSHGRYMVESGVARRATVGMFCLSPFTAWVRVNFNGRTALEKTILQPDCSLDDEGSTEYTFKPLLNEESTSANPRARPLAARPLPSQPGSHPKRASAAL